MSAWLLSLLIAFAPTEERLRCPSLLAATFEPLVVVELVPKNRKRFDELATRYREILRRLQDRSLRYDERQELLKELKELKPLAELTQRLLEAIRQDDKELMRELTAQLKEWAELLDDEPPIAGEKLVTEGRFIEAGLQKFAESGDGAGRFPWSRYSRLVLVNLQKVLRAKSLQEIKENCGELKSYKGGARYAGWYGVKVDQQWRVLFRWENERAEMIFIDDYHND